MLDIRYECETASGGHFGGGCRNTNRSHASRIAQAARAFKPEKFAICDLFVPRQNRVSSFIVLTL